MKLLSRKATCNSHGQDSSYFLGWQEYEKNPYDEIRNTTGIIQMGLAENQLSFDLLESWLANNPDAAQFKRDGQSIFRELALFQDYHGLSAFKNALVDFMAEIRGNKVNFDPNKLVLTAGATAANETLMFCLAEAGEAFLLPTPYYPGFDRDLKWRTEAEIVPIHCSSSNGFEITESALEEAYQQAQKRNLKVKGVLITNPSNPLGTSISRKELNHLISFITEKDIHLISDEIYSGTVFSEPGFISITEALIDRNLENTKVWNQVHIVYSLSKDLGLPGFRVGAIYSNNDAVVAAATKMSSFGLVSSQTQYLLSAMLSDKKFTSSYIAENKKRLSRRHDMLVSGLQNAGISCLKSNAGLFCWVDMRHLLSSNTFEAEMELWKKILYKVGLNISPGASCHCSEPGWFRVCFANMSEKTLEISMQRLKAFVDSTAVERDHRQSVRNSRIRSLSKWVFRLSSNQREPEQRALSPMWIRSGLIFVCKLLFPFATSRGSGGSSMWNFIVAEAWNIGWTSAIIAEAFGLLEGLKLAAHLGLKEIELETDSAAINRYMNASTEEPPWTISNIITEAKLIKDRFDYCTISHIYREGNSAADRLANYAIDDHSCLWIEKAPVFLNEIVYRDFIGGSNVRIVK